MNKEFTKVAIAKRADADAENTAHFLTFSLWSKGDKHRVYINDYKRRTLGYIDLDNNNEIVINDRQGNFQEEIDYAIAAFTAEYIDEPAAEAAETETAEAAEAEMTGTEKQVELAENIKSKIIDYVKGEHWRPEKEAKALEIINSRTDARWWIDNRDELWGFDRVCHIVKYIRDCEA